MKQKISLMVFAVCLASSFALGQGDKATTAVINDTTQARLRLGHFVYGGPNVDLYVDGKVAVNGGQAQVDIPVGYVNGYLYLEPGSHSVAVVPTGEALDQALIGPLDVPLAVGHHYTLATIGQTEDESLKPLVIDETAELEKVDATQEGLLVINNVAGTQTLDFDAYGKGPHDVPYGGFKIAGPGKQDFAGQPFAITVNGDPKAFIEGPHPDSPGGVGAEPGTYFLAGFMGHYPGMMGDGIDVGESGGFSNLDPITFLQNFSSAGYMTDFRTIKFDTFLAALRAAELTELLSSGDPYLLFVPTDEAFAALPRDQLDALMTDPKALAKLLRNHIVEGYVPKGSQAETPGGPFNRTFKNLLGETIKISEIDGQYAVNGTADSSTGYFVANGTQVHPVMNVLLPPE